jgi:signal transduction histidine kinase
MDSIAYLLSALLRAALPAQGPADFLEQAADVISRWAGHAPVSIEHRSGAERVSATGGPARSKRDTHHTASWGDSQTDTGIEARFYAEAERAASPTIEEILRAVCVLATIVERCSGMEYMDTSGRNIVEAIPLPTAIVERQGKVLQANAAFVALTGIGAVLTAEDTPVRLQQVLLDPGALVSGLKTAASGTRWEGEIAVRQFEDLRYCDAVLTRVGGVHADWFLLMLPDRTDQIKVQREAIAREKLATAGEIATGVAHEVNNPLAAIRIEAELLASSADNDETVDSARVIIREVDRASRIAKMLIHLTGRSGRELQSVQLNDLLQEVLDIRSQMDHWSGIDLMCNLDADLPPVVAPIGDLRQVFFNLLVNAEDAVRDTAQAVIAARSEVAGSVVRISICDSGPGVPAALRQRIFDPFFTTKDPDKGSGLGLSLSHSVVAEMGGRIWVEDSPLGGACFVVELGYNRDR